MDRHLGMLSASMATFAATNIDDAFLLTLFFARRIPTRRIVAGQYVGFSAIIGISLIGVWCALAIPHRWIHFLGVLPLARGIRRLLQARPTDVSQPRVTSESVASIALRLKTWCPRFPTVAHPSSYWRGNTRTSASCKRHWPS